MGVVGADAHRPIRHEKQAWEKIASCQGEAEPSLD